MNTVKLIGNVGKEVSIKNFDNNKLASFSLATNETYTTKNNEEKTTTTWHNIVAWGKIADQCERLLSKGKFISLEGKIQYRQYQNKENQTVNLTEIVVYKVEEVSKTA